MEMIISRDDAEKQLSSVLGETIQVHLKENPSTGYRWEIVKTEGSSLSYQSSSYTHDAGGTPGSEGVRSMRFTAVFPGCTTIYFKLKRSWEAESSAVDQLQLTICVKP